MIESMQSIFSDYNGIKLKIKSRKYLRNFPYIRILKTLFYITHGLNRRSHGKIEIILNYRKRKIQIKTSRYN